MYISHWATGVNCFNKLLQKWSLEDVPVLEEEKN